MFNRLATGLAAAASLVLMAAPASFAQRLVRWNTGGAAWISNSPVFKHFLKTGEIADRSLLASVRNSGWTADEIRFGMTKIYGIDFVRVSRYLNSREGVDFLSKQTYSYYPPNGARDSAVFALRSAIIKASIGGKLSSVGIIENLPVDFRLTGEDSSTGVGLVSCAPGKVDKKQAASLLTWYIFLPACIARDVAAY